MEHAILRQYLSRLPTSQSKSHLWLDPHGRALGRFFNASLSSVFQPIWAADTAKPLAWEAYARSFDVSEQGLHVWRLLEYVASDDESVALDRLCRLLHAINFFRQPESARADLFVSVHSRLLAAVEGNHGAAFRRILDSLELPHQQIVLQMPSITPSQRWVLSHVVENYRRNGFRIGVNASNLSQALELQERIRPDAIKIDAVDAMREANIRQLADLSLRAGSQLIFRKIERSVSLQQVQELIAEDYPILLQGYLFGLPNARLQAEATASQQLQPQSQPLAAVQSL